MKVVAALALALAALSPATVLADPIVVDVHDYVKGDCAQDDSAGFQQALNVWASGAQGGTLDLGTVCMILNRPVKVALPNSAPMFGTIRGDGQNLANIHCANGIGRCIELDQFWNGNISGFSVSGGGDGQLNAGSNGDFGLVLSNSTQDLGSCCGTISSVSVSGFARCWQFGDDLTPFGAAAEFVLDNVQANFCGGGDGQYSTSNGGMHCGGDINDPNTGELARNGGGAFWVGSSNSLDFVINKVGAVGSGTTLCLGYGVPTQFAMVGGGTTNTQHEVNMQGACSTVMLSEYRAEGGSNADGFVPVKAGGCPGQKVTIVNSQLRATPVYSPVSVLLDNGDTQVYLVNNNLTGQVQMVQGVQTVYAYGNTIATQGVEPFGFSDPNCCGGMRLYTAGNRNAQNLAGMWVTDWWPDNLQGYWLFPPNSQNGQQNPTPTPLPSKPAPTTTPLPPTPTAVPPTATPVPPTPTPLPPTATSTPDCRVQTTLGGTPTTFARPGDFCADQ